MRTQSMPELKLLKAILWIYIALCFIVAGLNYGYVPRATPEVASAITRFWHFYENWVKTLFIVLGSILTLRIIGKSGRTDLRKRNLIGLILSALVVHIVTPILLGNTELYFFTMPLPWTTTPLQLLHPETSFYLSRFPVWGAAGVSAAMIFYICLSVIVITGTLLFGRRWQCSTLCLFNGFASEVFSPAFPLIGKRKPVSYKALKMFSVLRWVFLALAVFLSVWWVLFLFGVRSIGDFHIVSKVELFKYLLAELLTAMFFWVAFLGRGYCYYCPLGTILGLLSKLSGQKIITNNTDCIACGKCSKVCPMSIDIKSKAQCGEAVKDLRCVGCGHCVDCCPTKTLTYSTKFLDTISNRRSCIKPPDATIMEVQGKDAEQANEGV